MAPQQLELLSGAQETLPREEPQVETAVAEPDTADQSRLEEARRVRQRYRELYDRGELRVAWLGYETQHRPGFWNMLKRIMTMDPSLYRR